MQKNVMIAIVAVIVVAVVAVAALAIFMNNGKEAPLPEFEEGTGTVYGNSDGNCYINETDKEIMKRIMDGKALLKDYPLADANCDGKVDDADIAIVDKYIKKEPCTLKVLDSEEKVIDVAYPISNIIVLCGSNLAPLMNILDVSDRIVGAAYTSEKFDPIRDYPVATGVENGTIKQITTAGTAADFNIITDLKDNKDCHFMMTELSSMYDLDSDDNVKVLNTMGIDVVRMEARDPGQDLRSLAVFGILLDKSSNVEAYQNYIKGVYDNIEKKIGSKFGSTGVLITSLTSNMSGQGSGYTKMIEMAGGYNALDMEESSIKIKTGDTWFLDPKYAVDIMFVGASCGYSDTGFKAANITSYKNLYKDHNAWTNGDVNIYSTSIPVVVRVAYYAEAMYPDCFEEGFAHNLHQEYVNKFFKTTYEVNDDLCMKKINVD